MEDNTEYKLGLSELTEPVLWSANSEVPPAVVSAEFIDYFASWIVGTVGPQTIESYTSTLRAHCLGKSLATVNDKKFFAIMRQEMLGRKMSLASVMRHTAAVKKFLVFLNERYDLPIVNLALIHCKRAPRKNPTYLEKEEIEIIRSVVPRTVLDLRDRTLFELLLDTGARISEALSINWQDINFEKGEVSVVGKGSKQRTLYLRESLPWIQDYLTNRKSDIAPLFVTYTKLHRLNRQSAAEAISELAKKAGITKRVYPHMVRHTFGTHMIWSGADPRTVQELMGHADLSMTLGYYVAVSKDRMKEAHATFGTFIGEDKGPQEQKYRLYR